MREVIGGFSNKNLALRDRVDEFNNNPDMHIRIAEVLDDFTSYEQIGYLMVDALRSTSGADIALINPGGVRIDNLAKGPYECDRCLLYGSFRK